jgi:hypothetical protein
MPAISRPATSHPPTKILRPIFADNNSWDWEMLREDFSDLEHLEPDAIDAEVDKRRLKQRKRLAKIFDKYCEAGSDARRVHDVFHCGGEQPDYNPKTEKLLSVEDRGDRVIVETKMAHNFKFRFKNELIKVGRTWRIRDNRKHKDESLPNPKWSRWDL